MLWYDYWTTIVPTVVRCRTNYPGFRKTLYRCVAKLRLQFSSRVGGNLEIYDVTHHTTAARCDQGLAGLLTIRHPPTIRGTVHFHFTFPEPNSLFFVGKRISLHLHFTLKIIGLYEWERGPYLSLSLSASTFPLSVFWKAKIRRQALIISEVSMWPVMWPWRL